MDHCTKGTDALLMIAQWDLVFGTVLLGSEGRHRVFRNYLAKMLMSTVGKEVELTVVKYRISRLMHQHPFGTTAPRTHHVRVVRNIGFHAFEM